MTYPDGDYLIYVHDELNRLDKIKNAIDQTIACYVYDNLSRKTQLDYLNGTQIVYSYNALSDLINIISRVTSTSNLICSFRYAYNNVGDRKFVIYGHESDEGDVYTYDNIYQLTNVKYNVIDPVSESETPGSSTFDSQMTYNFDNLGNRTFAVSKWRHNNL